MSRDRRKDQKRPFHQGQGHWRLLNPNSVLCVGRGQRRARILGNLLPSRKVTDYKLLQEKRERHLFKRKVLYELDKVDDLIQDFVAVLQEPFVPPPPPVPCLQVAGSHHRGHVKTLKELSGEGGLSLRMLGQLTQVMSRQEASCTFEAIAFTPPVTFLRINTLKGNTKEMWKDLMEGDVSAWLPRWSNVTMLAMDDPSNPCLLIRKIISEGRCSLQRERQWHQITLPLVRSNKERLKWSGNMKVCTKNSLNNVKRLTLFYSAYGSISSMVVMVLSAKAGDDVLELCATNSGKTSHIAAMQMNSGKLVANTLHLEEVQAIVVSNSRHDVQNCVVTNIEPALLAKMQAQKYQRVLVDAPSSGVGMVRLPLGARVCHTMRDLKYISTRQKLLLLNGADCVKQRVVQNSYLIYTTCSVLVEENEEVVQHLLVHRPQFRLVPTGLDIGQPGLTRYKTHIYHEDMCHTRRIYCHHYHMDGAFIAKFVLESKVNALETYMTKKLLQKQTNKQQEQHISKLTRDKKARLKQITPMKSMYKKGSHEWLKQTFIGEERGGDDYSDDD